MRVPLGGPATRFLVWLPTDLLDNLRLLADVERVSVSEVIRRAAQDRVDRLLPADGVAASSSEP